MLAAARRIARSHNITALAVSGLCLDHEPPKHEQRAAQILQQEMNLPIVQAQPAIDAAGGRLTVR